MGWQGICNCADYRSGFVTGDETANSHHVYEVIFVKDCNIQQTSGAKIPGWFCGKFYLIPWNVLVHNQSTLWYDKLLANLTKPKALKKKINY